MKKYNPVEIKNAVKISQDGTLTMNSATLEYLEEHAKQEGRNEAIAKARKKRDG